MPVPINPAGEEINAARAQLYINKYVNLKKCLFDFALPKVTWGELRANPLLEEMNTLYSSDANAFIFDKASFERFFNDPKEQAQFLMVILGAKYEAGNEKGNPTIVIAGVNLKNGSTNEYVSLNIPNPATEQPPRQAIIDFPNPADPINPNRIKFELL